MQIGFGADSVKIIKGSSRSIKVLIRTFDGETFDLDDATEIKAIFPGSPTKLMVTKTAGAIDVLAPTARGAMIINLTGINTNTLISKERQTFEIEITTALKTHIVQFKDMLDVESRIA